MSIDNYSIQTLFDNNEISVRAYNVCIYNNLLTTADLSNYVSQGHLFSNLRNCGKKTGEELSSIQKKYSCSISQHDDIKENEYINLCDIAINHIILIEEEIYTKQQLSTLFKGTEQFATYLSSHNDIFVDSASLSSKEIIAIWSVSVKILKQMIVLSKDTHPDIHNRLKNILANTSSKFELKKAELIINHFSEEQHTLLNKKFQTHLDALSVRANNVLSHEKFDYKSIVHFISSNENVNRKYRSCGKKTHDEIINEFKSYIKYIEELNDFNSEDIDNLKTVIALPFLNQEEISVVQNYKMKTGFSPMYYITLKYLTKANDRNIMLFRSFKGVGCDANRRVYKTFDISFERTRQICKNTYNELRKLPIFQIENWSHYNFIANNYINANDVSELINVSEFADSTTSLDRNTFAVITEIVSKHTRFDYKDSTILISDKITSIFNIRESVKDINRIVTSKCKKDTLIPIDTFIENYSTSNNPSEFKNIRECLKDICEVLFDLYVDDHYCCHIKQNFIDVKDEVYKIIEQKGRPMHLDEIFDEFNEKYPNHKYSTPTQLRPALSLSDKISALGKTSTYAIDKWNLQTDGIRELAYNILKESSIPLKLDEIVQAIANKSRRTTKNSLNTSIRLDKKERFVKFKGGYIGIADKTYDGKFIKLNNSDIQRHTFEERLSAFIQFIDTYHYSPQGGGSEEEQSMWRWFYNIEKGNLSISKEQKELFEYEIQKRRNYFLTGREYNFMKKCDELKLYLNNNYAMPTHDKEPQLYYWFNKNRKIYQTFNDKRKELFDGLLVYISDFGYTYTS